MSAQPSPLGTVTPEGVELEFEYATVGSRGIAYLLDLIIVWSLLLVFAIAEATFGFSGFVPGWVGLALLLLLVFTVQFGYPIGFETLWRGRTPGKAAMGVRVVTTEGAPVGFRHAVVRAVVGLIELLPLLGVPAIIASMVTSRGQRLGDLAAGTVVMRTRRGSRASSARVFAAPPGLEQYTAHLDVSRVGPVEYATVRDTLLRLAELAPAARRQIAEVVADGLLARVAPPPPAGMPAEAWLVCVAAAVQQRRPPVAARTHAPPVGPASTPSRQAAPPGAPATDVEGAGDAGARSDGSGPGGFVPPA